MTDANATKVLVVYVLLLERRSPHQAIPYLSKAVASLPAALEPCVCMLVARRRCTL